MSARITRTHSLLPLALTAEDNWRGIIHGCLTAYDELRCSYEETFGPDSMRLVPVLTWIGRLHLALECPLSAEWTFERAILALRRNAPEDARIAELMLVLTQIRQSDDNITARARSRAAGRRRDARPRGSGRSGPTWASRRSPDEEIAAR